MMANNTQYQTLALGPLCRRPTAPYLGQHCEMVLRTCHSINHSLIRTMWSQGLSVVCATNAELLHVDEPRWFQKHDLAQESFCECIGHVLSVTTKRSSTTLIRLLPRQGVLGVTHGDEGGEPPIDASFMEI